MSEVSFTPDRRRDRAVASLIAQGFMPNAAHARWQDLVRRATNSGASSELAVKVAYGMCVPEVPARLYDDFTSLLAFGVDPYDAAEQVMSQAS